MTAENDIKEFWNDGYCVIPDILSSEEVKLLKSECRKIVDDMNPQEHRTVFLSGEDQIGCDDYFLKSGDKIRFFYEKDVFNSEGDLTMEKHLSLNKIGHALHWFNPVFKKVTFGEQIKMIAQNLNLVDPVVTTGMYIFKNPKIGGAVIPHQDATYLYTEPSCQVYGIWIALEDATEENGCLWFVPGSHKNGQDCQRFQRTAPGAKALTELTGNPVACKDDEYVPVPVKKGSAVLIHGLVVHKSGQNHSDKPRPIYTFHLVDQGSAKWSEKNWIQPTEILKFPSLYNTII